MSARLDYLTSRDQRATARPVRTLGEALAERRPAWIRVRIHYSRGGSRLYRLDAWTADFKTCDPGATWQQLREAHPDIDWWRDHDIDAVTGAVYATPEPWEDGFLPEEDRTFGERRAPYLLADRFGYDRGWFGTVPPAPVRRAA